MDRPTSAIDGGGAIYDRTNPVNQCDMRMGFVSSANGGATWSAPQLRPALPAAVKQSLSYREPAKTRLPLQRVP